MKKIILSVLLLVLPLSTYAAITLYGPGGPHTALEEVAKLYTQQTGIEVKVKFGPQSTWNEQAKIDADILFGASEQSGLAIANDHSDRFDIYALQPVYLREAIILVKKGNPKKIMGLKDLTRPGIGIVVPDGMGRSNTSGTGVWEDMIGRTGNIDDIANFRKNIIAYTANSGSARKMFLEDSRIDAWITWEDWAKSNPDYGDIVKIERDLVIYRDLNLVLTKHPSKEASDFVQFITSPDAQAIFKLFGWVRSVKE